MQDNAAPSFWDDAPAFAQALCAPIPLPLPQQLHVQEAPKKKTNFSEDGSLITSDTDIINIQLGNNPVSTSPTISSSRKRQIPHSENHSYLAPAPPPSPASKRYRPNSNSNSFPSIPFLPAEPAKAVGEQVAADGLVNGHVHGNRHNNNHNNGPPNYLYPHLQAVPVPPILPLAPQPTRTVSSTPCVNEKEKPSPCMKSHTRRCREKVNEKFANLLEALPSAPAGVEVKHKAQILEYTIQVFRALLARRARLRVDIALATPESLREWCTNRPLSAFAALYARKHRWPYVETWKNGQLTAAHADASHSHLRNLANAANTNGSSADKNDKVLGIVERAMNSKRPEWLPTTTYPNSSHNKKCIARHEAMASVGINVILAIPTIGSDSVLLFMDTKHRSFSIETVDKLFQLANIVVDTHNENSLAQKQMQEDTPVQIEGLISNNILHNEEKVDKTQTNPNINIANQQDHQDQHHHHTHNHHNHVLHNNQPQQHHQHHQQENELRSGGHDDPILNTLCL